MMSKSTIMPVARSTARISMLRRQQEAIRPPEQFSRSTQPLRGRFPLTSSWAEVCESSCSTAPGGGCGTPPESGGTCLGAGEAREGREDGGAREQWGGRRRAGRHSAQLAQPDTAIAPSSIHCTCCGGPTAADAQVAHNLHKHAACRCPPRHPTHQPPALALTILVLAVGLQVLAHGHRLLDEVVQVLGQLGGQAWRQSRRGRGGAGAGGAAGWHDGPRHRRDAPARAAPCQRQGRATGAFAYGALEQSGPAPRERGTARHLLLAGAQRAEPSRPKGRVLAQKRWAAEPGWGQSAAEPRFPAAPSLCALACNVAAAGGAGAEQQRQAGWLPAALAAAGPPEPLLLPSSQAACRSRVPSNSCRSLTLALEDAQDLGAGHGLDLQSAQSAQERGERAWRQRCASMPALQSLLRGRKAGGSPGPAKPAAVRAALRAEPVAAVSPPPLPTPHLGDAVAVAQDHADLGGGHALLGHLGDHVRHLASW